MSKKGIPKLPDAEVYEDALTAGKALKHWRAKRGLTQSALVEQTTIKNIPYLSWMENGRQHPGKSEHFPSIAKALSLPVEEIRRFAPDLILQVNQIGDGSAAQEYIAMPVYGIACASRPNFMEDEPLEGITVPVHASDFKPNMVLLRVDGDSMDKGGGEGIMDEDVVAVDTSDLDINAGRVYVVCVDGEGCTVKRARKLGDEVWLFSDNPDQNRFEPFKPESACVVGRVKRVYRIPDVEL